MYGYVVPDKSNMLMKEYALFRAYYCGVCKATGALYGQLPRFTTNYDIAFLSAFCHDYTRFVPEIKQQGCVLNPFKKKDIIMPSPLLNKVCAANIMLSYYKLTDDIIDKSGRMRRFARSAIKSAYKKAKKTLPELDAGLNAQYERLRAYEKGGEKSIDKISDCSAKMMERTACAVMETEDENVKTLFYNLGKWVYIADALDDLEEDYAKKCFNPLLNIYGIPAKPEAVTEGNQKDNGKKEQAFSKKEFVNANRNDIEFMLNTALNAMAAALDNIPKSHSTGLIDNIVFKGLRTKTKALLEAEGKLPHPRI